ncbi:MAG: hypothetical protein EOP51_12250 [Sphingobacteriales bacterium]|nr:MAG: hypothetical protein EOP51_12250 [Sphingobacteriales bacterium]
MAVCACNNDYDILQPSIDNTDTNTYTIANCQTEILGLRSYPDAVGNHVATMYSIDLKGNETRISTVGAGKYSVLAYQGVVVGYKYITASNNSSYNNSGSSNLVSVDLSSKNTAIIIGSDRMAIPVYSSTNKMFYAVKHAFYQGAPDTLVRFTTSNDAVINDTNIAIVPANIISVACNQQNGDVYMIGGEANTQLFKYANGTLTNIPLNNVQNQSLQGLCYNRKDGLLYATLTANKGVRVTTIVDISPSNGYVTMLRNMPVSLGIDVFSVAMDDCNGNYILTGLNLNGQQQNFIAIYNCSKKSISTHTTPYFYYGLAVKYN